MARRRQEEARRIGVRIAELRERHHLTQAVAALRLGVAYRTYQTWEAGDATPRWHNFEKIAKLYGVSVDEILGNPPSPSSPSQLDRLEKRLAKIERDITRQGSAVERLLSAAAGRSDLDSN